MNAECIKKIVLQCIQLLIKMLFLLVVSVKLSLQICLGTFGSGMTGVSFFIDKNTEITLKGKKFKVNQ